MSVEELVPWLWIAAIAVVFWLLIIRPASRRQKQVMALQAALAVGDDVILTSGVFATIVGIGEDHLDAEVAPGVVIKIVRGAVSSVRRDEVAPAAEPSSDGDDLAERDVVDRPDTEER